MQTQQVRVTKHDKLKEREAFLTSFKIMAEGQAGKAGKGHFTCQ